MKAETEALLQMSSEDSEAGADAEEEADERHTAAAAAADRKAFERKMELTKTPNK